MKPNVLKTVFFNKQTFFLLLPAVILCYFAVHAFYYSQVETSQLPTFRGKITMLKTVRKRNSHRTDLILKIDSDPKLFFRINSMSESRVSNRAIVPKLKVGDSVAISTYPGLVNLGKVKNVVKFARDKKVYRNFTFIEKKISAIFFWVFSIPSLCLFTVYILLARKRLKSIE